MKRYDLMHSINTRGTFCCSQACIPHLQEGGEPAHPQPLAAAQHGGAVVRAARRLHDGEVRHEHVRARHGRGVRATRASRSTRCGRAPAIATAAVANLLGGDTMMAQLPQARDHGRRGAYAILTQHSRECTGNFFIDDDVLRRTGVTDFSVYRYEGVAEEELMGDFFV